MSWNKNVSFYCFRLRKTSGRENQSLPWISRPIELSWLFTHRRYEVNYVIFYDQSALSPKSLSAKSTYISSWLWQEIENFLMQIISHMTDGNQFLNRGISFSLRKPTRLKIYLWQPQNSPTLLSVKIAADQHINRSSVIFRWIRVWATGKYLITLS